MCALNMQIYIHSYLLLNNSLNNNCISLPMCIYVCIKNNFINKEDIVNALFLCNRYVASQEITLSSRSEEK
jgi:hypothetical protein